MSSRKVKSAAMHGCGRMIAVIIAAVVIIMLIVPCGSAGAGTMQWSVVNTPDSTDNIVVSPSEVNVFSLSPDGMTIFASDIASGKLYRSKNGGYFWDDISARISGSGASLPVWNIVVAPDNPSIIAAVTSSGGLPRAVFISTDGGDTWKNTGLSVTADIGALDISPNYGTYDIAAGTRTGAGGGKVYTAKLPGGSGWADQGITGDVLALRFSPGYSGDNSLIIVNTDASGTFLNLGIRDTAANLSTWGTWGPVEITASGGGTSPKVNQILSADIELPFDFSGQASSQRRIYVSTDAPGGRASGIFRFDDTTSYHIMQATSSKRIASIAYWGTYGSGKLLAGEVRGDPATAGVPIWFTDAPVVCPDTCWYQTKKPPTGAAATGYGNANVAWSTDGSKAYCATSSANLDGAGWPNGYLTAGARDESAFSYSINNGLTWNQLGLIDTSIDFLADVAPSPYSDVIYLASINTNAGYTGFDSMWKSVGYPVDSKWERVYCLLTANNDTIVRLSPVVEDYSVFLADRQTSDLFESKDKGDAWNTVLPGVAITDFSAAIISGTPHLYVLENIHVREGVYHGSSWKWGSKTGTQLNSGHTIAALNDGRVVVGDAGGGMVAYSLNGASEFIRLAAVQTPGNMHVGLDPRFGNYTVIYTASDAPGAKLYGINVTTSSSWIDLQAPDGSFYGVAPAGTFYGVWSASGASGVDRTLNPEAGPPTIEWDAMTAGLTAGVLFTREPSALKYSDGVDLWAIDNRPYTAATGRLWTYCDCLASGLYPSSAQPDREVLLQSPTLTTPADNTHIPPVNGTDMLADIQFKWKHPTPASGYELLIAEDKNFASVIVRESIRPEIPNAPAWTLSTPSNTLKAGRTYYWKVRVNRDALNAKNSGQWSETWSFNTAGSSAEPHTTLTGPSLFSPLDGAAGIDPSPTFAWAPLPGAAQYKVTIYSDISLLQPVDSALTAETAYAYEGELSKDTTYYWQVRAVEPFESEPHAAFSFTVRSQAFPGVPDSIITDLLWLWIAIGVIVAAGIAAVVLVALRKKTH